MAFGAGPVIVDVPAPRVPTAQQWVFDAVVAAALTCYGVAAALHGGEYAESGTATALLVGAAGAAQVLRRRRPSIAFAVTSTALALLAVLVAPFQAGSSLLITLVAAYSAMAYAARRGVVVVGASALVLAESLPGRFGGPSSGAFVALVLGLAGAAGLVVRRMRNLAAANAALLELVQRDAELRTQAAVDDERDRIARELHDILSHSLAVVALQTGAAEHAWGRDDERARAAVHSARKAALEAIEQLRVLLRAARTAPEEGRSPLPDLDGLATLVSRSSSPSFPVTLEVRGEVREVAPQVQASVYRAAQEGVTNALKHAGESGCRLVLTYGPSEVSVVVEDGGQSTTGFLQGSQVGLAGLRERATILGGRIDAGPLAKGGWRLEAEFPGVISILVVDDQAVVRTGLRTLLEAEADLRVVAELDDGTGVVEAVREHVPDVVLMDVRMPRMNGIEATRALAAEGAAARVCVLTTYGVDDYVFDALAAGAGGFLLKTDSADRIITTVRAVAAGEHALGEDITRALVERYLSMPPASDAERAAVQSLTSREREVLALLAKGLSNSEIAARLVVGEGTIKTHVARILMKLNLRDRTQAAIFAHQLGATGDMRTNTKGRGRGD